MVLSSPTIQASGSGLTPGQTTAAVLVGYTIVSFFSVCARCLSRFWILKSHGIDDYLMLGAQLCAIGFCAMALGQLHYGLGDPDIYLDTSEFEPLMKYFYASLPFYHAGLALVKDSILFQYLRFLPPSRCRRLAWFMISFTSAFAVLQIIWGFVICMPVSYTWDRSIPGKCYLLKLGYINAFLAIISDLIICVLPMPVLRQLKITRAQRNTLIAVFCFGGWSCIAAACRIPSLIAAVNSPVFGSDTNLGTRWSSIELNTGMIAACIPTLKPLLQRFNLLPRALSDRSPKNSAPSSNPDSELSLEELTPMQIPQHSKTVSSVRTYSKFGSESSDTVSQGPRRLV